LKRKIDLPTMESEYPDLATQLQGKRPHVELPPEEQEMSMDALMRAERKKRVVQYIREKPTESSRLLKVWLTEE
jgi:hypothetical protein